MNGESGGWERSGETPPLDTVPATSPPSYARRDQWSLPVGTGRGKAGSGGADSRIATGTLKGVGAKGGSPRARSWSATTVISPLDPASHIVLSSRGNQKMKMRKAPTCSRSISPRHTTCSVSVVEWQPRRRNAATALFES